jgi:type II secretory pathway component PulM
MSIGEKYLLAAYLVFLALVLVYVVIMVRRLSSLERDLAELREIAKGRDEAEAPREPEPVA